MKNKNKTINTLEKILQRGLKKSIFLEEKEIKITIFNVMV